MNPRRKHKPRVILWKGTTHGVLVAVENENLSHPRGVFGEAEDQIHWSWLVRITITRARCKGANVIVNIRKVDRGERWSVADRENLGEE